MHVANRRSSFWRVTTSFSLLAALGIALASATGCTSGKKSESKSPPITSEKKAPPQPPQANRASYGVSWMNGGAAAEGTYHLAYVMQGTEPRVIDDATTPAFQKASGTADVSDIARAEKIRSYLLMSPIRAIIGDRTDFLVGMTYDGVVKEGGKPLFTYACDREEVIAGVKGQHMTVKTAKTGTTELELVLSKDYPFPLYVKEHTGTEPLQIFLKDRQ